VTRRLASKYGYLIEEKSFIARSDFDEDEFSDERKVNLDSGLVAILYNFVHLLLPTQIS